MSRAPVVQAAPTGVSGLSIPQQYELLLSKLSAAEQDLSTDDACARSSHLEEAAGIVFDLLYSLDFKTGGELVPRLAALYGYLANELLNVGRTRDRSQLSHLRDMITTLRQAWYGSQGSV
ncbi:MAG TPA: flagellar protein FliS [Gemmatimonadaceae bacterium]